MKKISTDEVGGQDARRVSSSLKSFSKAASVIVMLTGCLVLVGWVFDIRALKSVLPDLVTMKVNTALSFILSGFSLWQLRAEGDHLPRRSAQACAFLVALVSLLTLVEYLLGSNLGLDQLLFRDTQQAVGMSYPGRMSPATALNFLLLGIALLLLSFRREWSAQLLALVAALVSLLAFSGYAYDAHSLYQIAPYSSIALHTTLAFLVLCAGILSARAERGWMTTITSATAGGLLVRRLLSAVIIIPLVLGWLRLKGQQAGLYDTEFGAALLAFSNLIILSALVWWNAGLLSRMDKRRRRVEVELRESEKRLQLALSAAKMGVWELNMRTDETFSSPECGEIVGVTGFSGKLENFERLIHPEDINRHKEAVKHAIVARTLLESEFRIVGANSDVRWLANFGRADYDEAGEPLRVVGTVQDITERKRTEEALRQSERRLGVIYDSVSAPLAFMRVESDGRFRYVSVNEAFLKTRGLKEEQIVGRTVDEVAPESLREAALANLNEAVRSRTTVKWEVRTVASDVWRVKEEPPMISRVSEVAATPLFDIEENYTYLIVSIHDITDIKQAEEQLIASREQLRALTAHLQAVREAERTRIAREVHDVLGQLLTALKIDMSMYARKLSDCDDEAGRARMAERIVAMQELIDEIIKTVQHISAELRPGVLDTLGLVAAIEWQARDFETRTGITCVADIPSSSVEISPEKATAMFRIFQEILTNVARHAQASAVNISLREEEGEIVLVVRDNGRGVTEEELTNAASLGLLGMSERARLFGGSVLLTGSRGAGTQAVARLPLDDASS